MRLGSIEDGFIARQAIILDTENMGEIYTTVSIRATKTLPAWL